MARPVEHEKRRELAQRAVEALERLGIEASMTDLAQALGLKRPTLLYHFPSKSAIVEQALADLLAEQARFVIARQEEHAHPIDQLFAQIVATHEFHHGKESRVLFLSQLIATGGTERAAALMHVGNMAFEARRQLMAARLRAGIAAGTVAPHDVDALISVVRSFNDGLIIQRVMLGADLAPIHAFIWEHVLSPLKREPARGAP
ncbi:MAG: TetR/AcrR family transcriptional regulator [Sandaracinaceae bacterium]|nr:TetR/AcrR family transcriptional regulator [Sandaracinaceae bacterium]